MTDEETQSEEQHAVELRPFELFVVEYGLRFGASSTSEPTSAFARRRLPIPYASQPIVRTIAITIAMFRADGVGSEDTHSPPVMQCGPSAS